jgi:hypothetical protein
VSFPFTKAAAFEAQGSSVLKVEADRAVGLVWRPLPEGLRRARQASWRWRADEAVRPTDLTRKGEDDRVLSVYFLFGEPGDIGKSATALLRSQTASALVYVFGSEGERGRLVESPHMQERGKFVLLRPATSPRATWLSESVDLTQDYRRAYGREPPLLIGVAVSSDSDDTGGRNRALLADLAVK